MVELHLDHLTQVRVHQLHHQVPARARHHPVLRHCKPAPPARPRDEYETRTKMRKTTSASNKRTHYSYSPTPTGPLALHIQLDTNGHAMRHSVVLQSTNCWRFVREEKKKKRREAAQAQLPRAPMLLEVRVRCATAAGRQILRLLCSVFASRGVGSGRLESNSIFQDRLASSRFLTSALFSEARLVCLQIVDVVAEDQVRTSSMPPFVHTAKQTRIVSE